MSILEFFSHLSNITSNQFYQPIHLMKYKLFLFYLLFLLLFDVLKLDFIIFFFIYPFLKKYIIIMLSLEYIYLLNYLTYQIFMLLIFLGILMHDQGYRLAFFLINFILFLEEMSFFSFFP